MLQSRAPTVSKQYTDRWDRVATTFAIKEVFITLKKVINLTKSLTNHVAYRLSNTNPSTSVDLPREGI